MILIVGATGMTGKLLLGQLLSNGHKVRAIVRTTDRFGEEIMNHPNLTIITAAILDLTDSQLEEHVSGCEAVISCLGHNLSLKGMFGQPRQLCTQSVGRLARAICANDAGEPTKFILMNSVGVANPVTDATRALFERLLLGFLYIALPPHRDNVRAAGFLANELDRDNQPIEWCSVRPDSLINAGISDYQISSSPTTRILTGRPTSRANVAHFMKSLIEDTDLWNRWKFEMPVIMDSKTQ